MSRISRELARILTQLIDKKCAPAWDLQLIFILLVRIFPNSGDIRRLMLEKRSKLATLDWVFVRIKVYLGNLYILNLSHVFETTLSLWLNLKKVSLN